MELKQTTVYKAEDPNAADTVIIFNVVLADLYCKTIRQGY